MKYFVLLILLPVLLLYGCYKQAYNHNVYEFHFRRTVVIDTPNGEVRGSTVSKIRFSHTDGALVVPAAKGFGGGVSQGEATVVDLGDGRYLFVLLGKETAQQRETHRAAYDAARKGGDGWIRRWMEALDQQRTPRPVPPEVYPMLVTFGDLSDPASVMRVDPADLAATFGAGFALREITLEITDDAVTDGVVEGVLKAWLEMVKGRAPSDTRDIPALHLPNDSPRGWVNLGALSFWSLDTVMELKEKYK